MCSGQTLALAAAKAVAAAAATLGFVVSSLSPAATAQFERLQEDRLLETQPLAREQKDALFERKVAHGEVVTSASGEISGKINFTSIHDRRSSCLPTTTAAAATTTEQPVQSRLARRCVQDARQTHSG